LTAPESTLKKHHDAITYHRAREAQAAGFIHVDWERGETQISDVSTKLMPAARAKAEGTHRLCASVNPILRMATKMEANTPFFFLKQHNADGRAGASVEQGLLFVSCMGLTLKKLGDFTFCLVAMVH
jgi:hypothetical protein